MQDFFWMKHFSPITYSFIIRGFNGIHICTENVRVWYACVPNKYSIQFN